MSSSSSAAVVHDEFVFKIVLLGDTRVGKTSILKRLLGDDGPEQGDSMHRQETAIYSPTHQQVAPPSSSSPKGDSDAPEPTIGVDFYSRVVKGARQDSLDARLQFWDCGGDPTFRPADFSSVLRGAAMVICVFDTTMPASFTTLLDYYFPLVVTCCPKLSQPCLLVVENKVDERTRVEAAKSAMSVAMRKLKKAASSTQSSSSSSSSSPVALEDVELVDLRAVQGELFGRFPDAGYVDMCVFDNEKVQFLLSGIVDILIDAFEERDRSRDAPTRYLGEDAVKATQAEKKAAPQPLPSSYLALTANNNNRGGKHQQHKGSDSEEDKDFSPRSIGSDDDAEREEEDREQQEDEQREADEPSVPSSSKTTTNTPPIHPSLHGRVTNKNGGDNIHHDNEKEDSQDTSDDDDDESKRKKKKKKANEKKHAKGDRDGCGCGCSLM